MISLLEDGLIEDKTCDFNYPKHLKTNDTGSVISWSTKWFCPLISLTRPRSTFATSSNWMSSMHLRRSGSFSADLRKALKNRWTAWLWVDKAPVRRRTGHLNKSGKYRVKWESEKWWATIMKVRRETVSFGILFPSDVAGVPRVLLYLANM